MTTTELQRMAARGEEDGHDRTWQAQFTRDRRAIDAMAKAADHAAAELRMHEAEWVGEPRFYPPGYFQARGRPKTKGEGVSHDCHETGKTGDCWRF